MSYTKKSNLARKSAIWTGSVNNVNKSQLRKIKKAKNNNNIDKAIFHKLYMRVDTVWQYKGQSCRYCNTVVSDPVVIDKHHLVCTVINKKDREDTEMPIHRITRNGTTYYRYGTTGKEYRTLEEAQRQAAAIKASQAKSAEKKK